MRKEKVFCIGVSVLVLLCASVQAVQLGPDLLNGTGGFETVSDRAVWTVVGNSAFSTDLPNYGSWSWHAGPATAYGEQMQLYFTNPISTVANRQHRLAVAVRTQVSSPSWIRYTIGNTDYTESTTLQSASIGFVDNFAYYTTGSNENSTMLVFKMYANSADDNGYIDDVNLCRERVVPMVGNDSVQNTLVQGRVNHINFNTIQMPGADPTIAFDPDIAISAPNSTISNTQWISDNEVVTDITPSVAGSLILTFRNQYSDEEYVYPMTVVTPPQSCGQAGSIYLQADLNHDCRVTLKDFAIWASQWMQCTDVNVAACGF